MSGTPDLLRTLHQVQRDHILEVIAAFGYNLTHASKALGCSLRKLRYKCREYGVSPLPKGRALRKKVQDGRSQGQDIPSSPAVPPCSGGSYFIGGCI